MYELINDVRIAIRRLRHSPGFVLVTVLSLTMAIGANLVVFGVMNAAILRPLHVAGADRLWMIVQKPAHYISQSYPDYLDLRSRNNTFTDMAAYRFSEAGVSTEGNAKKSWSYEASSNYFDLLGVQPELGRVFHANEEHGPNSMPYVVLSDWFWRSRFHADPAVIGAKVDLNKHPFTIIGVAPPTFNGTELMLWPDFWVPMVNEEQIEGYSYLDKRYNHGLWVVGLLKPGVAPQQASQNLNAITAQLAKQYPATNDQMGARLLKPGLLGDVLGDAAREFLTGVLLLALLVLVAACVNLASIFAARASDRGREMAIRMAIGSSRWRMLRQVLAEAALLSLGGGAAGTFIAAALLRFLSQWQPIGAYPIHVTVVADARVYGIAILLAVASGVLPALLTLRPIWKTDAMQAMKPGGTQGVYRRFMVRDLLLGLQVALCALLVTCALVGFRGMERQLRAPIGFQREGVTLAETEMNMAGYSDAASLPLQKRMLDEAARIPGVTAVGTIDDPPLNGGGSDTPVYREGTTDFRSSNSVADAHFYSISPGFLGAAETTLLAGRDFTWHDDEHTPKVAIVNQTFAHMLFGNSAAVGGRFMEPGPTTYEVVGVVEDGKYDSLTENPTAAMFYPLAQTPDNDTTLVVRSNRSTAEMAEELAPMIAKIDPNLPVKIESWSQELELVLFPARVATVALGVLGLLAGMLAATGVFGIASYVVARRLREMGIRVALGAQRMQVLRAALGRTMLLLGIGSVAGLALGALSSHLLSSIVYQATVYDPVVLTGAVAAMILIGAMAAAVPARRAVSVEPAVLLREE